METPPSAAGKEKKERKERKEKKEKKRKEKKTRDVVCSPKGTSLSVSTPATIIEAIKVHMPLEASKVALAWLGANGEPEVSYSYSELLTSAGRVAWKIHNRWHIAEGERILLLYPPGLAFMISFLGCIAAGVIAVPAFPPAPQTLKRDLPRLNRIIHNCSPKLILTTSEYRTMIHAAKVKSAFLSVLPGDPPPKWADLPLKTAKLSAAIDQTFFVASAGDTVAFLQYTSGSTGDPKGVTVLHRNVIANLHTLRNAIGVDRNSVLLTWVPHYHDLGLVAHALLTLVSGATFYWMSPLTFLMNPNLWLQALSTYQVTHGSAPNFGFELAVREYDGRPLKLDLLHMLMMSAERVHLSTFQKFLSTFAPHGLKEKALRPGYGLAEFTIYVTDRDPNMPVQEVDGVVRIGPVARPPTEIRVVDPETLLEAPAGGIGEIWLNGPSKAAGYWNRPDLSEATFRARIKDDASGNHYLRTGDLGRIIDGQLYVVGRIKNVIIIRGRNYHAEDIEFTVQNCSSNLRAGSIAAISVEAKQAPGEKLVILAELRKKITLTDDQLNELITTIRTAVQVDHGVQSTAVYILPARSLPKTSSGKLQRIAAKEMLIARQLKVLHQWIGEQPLF